jgi:hypothetical protein
MSLNLYFRSNKPKLYMVNAASVEDTECYFLGHRETENNWQIS